MSDTITMEEAAAALDGSEYGNEGSRELFARMKVAGLVAAFGASDDLIELRGAIHDEFGAFDGGKAHIDDRGLPKNACPYFEKRLEWAPYVEALWCPEGVEGEPSWLMKMSDDRPTMSFSIMEEGDLYCIGIVFPLRWTAEPEVA
jgi:hypothetical protein